MNPARYGPPDGDLELRQYAAAMAQAFAIEPNQALDWATDKGLDGVRVLRGNEVEAGLAVYRFGQFFGGRGVPAWGVAGVAVRPELRGSGRARELMSALLREMHAEKVALSPLYPASAALYRNLGWSTAGTRMLYRVDPARIVRTAGEPNLLALVEADEEVRRRYRQAAQHKPGNLDRNEQIWRRVVQASADSPLHVYLAGDDGYILYTQRREGATLKYEIQVRDFVCPSPQSVSAVAALLAGHGTLVSGVTFAGAPADPLLEKLLPDQNVHVHDRLDWMLRVVRVKEALESRGYSPTVAGKAVLHIQDEQLPDNSGPWTLTFEQGDAKVKAGGGSGPIIDAAGLASLYSGCHDTRALRSTGRLSGVGDYDSLLDAAFSGPPPWMPDFF